MLKHAASVELCRLPGACCCVVETMSYLEIYVYGTTAKQAN